MSFDEQPDGDPHGECAAEIQTLGLRIYRLEAALREVKALGENFKDPYIPGETFAKIAATALETEGKAGA
jgi:hypothetical protein